MTGSRRAGRARPFIRAWLVAFLPVIFVAARAMAQVPDTIPPVIPSDTFPADTVRVRIPPEELSGDTIPAEVRAAGESIARAPVMPEFPPPGAVGWDVARWTWGRDELSRLQGMTLLEFIERLPGFTVFRAGGYGRPAGITAVGMGGGRVRLRVAGFEMDPHDASSFPLDAISLTDITRVTIERTLSEILIDIVPFRLTDPEPYSVVHLGTGVFETRLLRALFSRGVGSRSVATGSFDLATTGGIGLSESYATNTTAFRWSYATTETSAVEAEIRRTSIDRAEDEFPLDITRTDFVVRGRTTVGDRGTVEAFAGRSDAEDDIGDGASHLASVQAGARAAYATERLIVRGGFRGRTDRGPALPATPFEVDATALFRPSTWFRLEAGANAQAGAGSAANARVVASTIPFRSLALFGAAEFGTRLDPLRTRPEAMDSEEATLPEFTLISVDAAGFRGGLEIAAGAGSAGAALFRSATSPVSPFGLPFDLAAPPVDVPAMNGFEVYFDVAPIPGFDALRVDGWYTRWFGPVNRPYTPADFGRFGMQLHGVYIGGELEPFARLELVRQGPALMPLDPVSGADRTMPSFMTLNFDFRIRILDVQAFIIWDNILTAQASVPLVDPPTPQPRIVYGASWRFRN